MSFELKKNKDFTDRVDKAFGAMSQLKRGDTFLYSQIVELTGIPRNDERFRRVCSSLKRRSVRQLKTVLKAVDNVGYRLLTAEEQIRDNPVERSRKAGRQMFRGARETECVPQDGLSMKLREVQSFTVGMMDRGKREANRAKRLFLALKNAPTVPLRT